MRDVAPAARRTDTDCATTGTIRAKALDDEAIAAHEDPGELCRRVAHALPGLRRSLAVAVGGHLTTLVLGLEGRPLLVWTVTHAPLLAAVAERAGAVQPRGRELVTGLRVAAGEALREARLAVIRPTRCRVVAASRLARAVVTLGAEGGRVATPRELAAALETLASTWDEQVTGGASQAWIRPTLVGAAMVEGVLGCLGGGRIFAMPEGAPLP